MVMSHTQVTLTYPPSPSCRHTYRLIQAYLIVRHSTRVGNKLRQIVGDKGDISSLASSALVGKFNASELPEAERLVKWAEETRRKPRKED